MAALIALFLPAVVLGLRPPRWLGAPLAWLPLAAPFLIDASPLQTWGIAVAGVVQWGRALDFLRFRPALSLPRYVLFMTVWPNAMTIGRFQMPLREPAARVALRHVALGAVKIAVALGLLTAGAALGFPESSSLGDHLFTVAEVFLFFWGCGDLFVSAGAAVGYGVDGIFRNLFVSRSVLDFWARYNQMVHHWYVEHIFKRTGGRRRPRTAVLATFVFSGLMHEYLFYAAAPELLGWQLAFFSLQGLGALAEAALRRRIRWGRRTGAVIAIAFVTACSPLFLRCLEPLLQVHDGIGQTLLTQVTSR